MLAKLKTSLAESPTTLPRGRLNAPWWRAALVVAGCGVWHASTAEPTANGTAPEVALTEVLARTHDLSASPSDVFWVEPRPGVWWQPWHRSKAWVLAGNRSGFDDVYLVEARRSPEGGLVAVTDVHNVSDTNATSERLLNARGRDAVWFSGNEQSLLRLVWATLGSNLLEASGAASFTWTQRLQWHLTWLQEFGEWHGVAKQQYKLIPPPRTAYAAFEPEYLDLRTNHGSAELRPGQARGSGQHVALTEQALAKPGNWLTWSVDRLRAMPWFGDENMQRLKAVVYRAWDTASRRFGLGVGTEDTRVTLVSPSSPPGAPADALPARSLPGHSAALPPELARAWPPPPVEPLISPPEPDEGKWLSLRGDPFIKPSSDPGGLFFTTFVRPDPERTYARILVTVWDPQTVELHTQSGTEEPKTATGETGSGLVPRDGSVAENLVAAFNGGFQATHGDFGMAAEGTVYVPPLPYAATVATDRNGNVGFGTWPERQNMPLSLVDLRQNLTPLVAGGKFNPYQRTWWGGVPSGWEDDTRTVRSGLCLTANGLVAYFYGAKVDAENLAKAMLAVKCTYGLHLDMNQGHTGLEFYHVAPVAELPPLALTLDHVWQAEGPVPEAPAFAFRGRRMFRAMQLMNFPRYIQRETRDFFYLTRRELLPSSADWTIAPAATPVYPYAAATRSSSTSGHLIHLLELDPQYLQPRSQDTDLIIATLALPATETPTKENLYWTDGKLETGSAPPSSSSVALLPVTRDPGPAQAAFCVHQRTGRLVYAEFADPQTTTRDMLEAALTREGCSPSTLRGAPSGRFSLGGVDLSGHPRDNQEPALQWAYRRPKRHFDLFPETPIVPPAQWKPMQAKAD